jgi:hypothetical protein
MKIVPIPLKHWSPKRLEDAMGNWKTSFLVSLLLVLVLVLGVLPSSVGAKILPAVNPSTRELEVIYIDAACGHCRYWDGSRCLRDWKACPRFPNQVAPPATNPNAAAAAKICPTRCERALEACGGMCTALQSANQTALNGCKAGCITDRAHCLSQC